MRDAAAAHAPSDDRHRLTDAYTRTCATTPSPRWVQFTSVYGTIYYTDLSKYGTKHNGCVGS